MEDWENVIDMKWWNSGDKSDVEIEMCDAPFVLPSEFAERVEEEWKNIDDGSIYNGSLLNFVEAVDGFDKIYFSEGIDYKTITSLRSDKNFARVVSQKHGIYGLCIMSPVLTSDGKLVLSRRKFFGDWNNSSWELCGGFIESSSKREYSLIDETKRIFLKDHGELGEDSIEKIIPIAFYLYPEILEAHFLCITKIRLSSDEILSGLSENDVYDEILCFDFSEDGLGKMKDVEGSWHPPSKTIASLLHGKVEDILLLID